MNHRFRSKKGAAPTLRGSRALASAALRCEGSVREDRLSSGRSPLMGLAAGGIGFARKLYEQPWLVPQSVQTPQAPARITFEDPQWEQGESMYMLPRAIFTRSA